MMNRFMPSSPVTETLEPFKEETVRAADKSQHCEEESSLGPYRETNTFPGREPLA
jgi:hypothetical protein